MPNVWYMLAMCLVGGGEVEAAEEALQQGQLLLKKAKDTEDLVKEFSELNVCIATHPPIPRQAPESVCSMSYIPGKPVADTSKPCVCRWSLMRLPRRNSRLQSDSCGKNLLHLNVHLCFSFGTLNTLPSESYVVPPFMVDATHSLQTCWTSSTS